MFAGNFAPLNWAFCDGSLQSIAANPVLFQLIGTTYGGDGVQTFGLPDLRGRFPMHQGTNFSTGSNYVIGEQSGAEAVTLTVSQLPPHSHAVVASTAQGNLPVPNNAVWAESPLNGYSSPGLTVSGSFSATSLSGGSQPHDNMPPFLAVSFIISFFGVFPSQN